MRISTLSTFVLALMASVSAYGQCTVNAGPDIDPCLNTPAITLPNPGGLGSWTGAPANMLSVAGVFTPNTVGTYTLTLTLTDGNGCTATDQIIAQVRPLPVTNAGPDQSICQGQTVQLGATATSANGPIVLYTWSGGVVSNSLSQNPTATPGITTTYNVTAVDIEQCSKADQVTVFVIPPPAVNAGVDISVCNQPVPTNLTGQSPPGGTWTGTGVTPGGVFTPPGVGSYTLTYTYTNAQGCSNSDTRVVNVFAAGNVNAGPDATVCINGAPVQLTAVTPGGVWSGGSGQVNASGLFTPATVGSHTLTYTVVMGACTATDQVIVNVTALPSANAGPDLSFCAGTNTSVTGSATGGTGTYDYSWTASNFSSSNATITVSPNAATTYTLTVTDDVGCQGSDAVIVTPLPLPSVDAGTNLSFCEGNGPVNLTGQSPAGGTWSGPGTTPGGTFTPPGVGNFTITYSFTNGQGCTSSDTRTVAIVAAGSVNAGSDQSVCLNSPAITLNPITPGGIWSGTGVTPGGVFTPSAPGTSTLTYTVNLGVCTASDQVLVTVHSLPSANAGADVSICTGTSTALNGSAAGGLGPYQLDWLQAGNPLGSGTPFSVSPASTTTYTLTVTDANNCTASDAVLVSVNALPVVAAGADLSVCHQPNPVILTGYSPAGGSWSGSGVTGGGMFTSPGPGSYVLTYTFTNGSGCTNSDQMTVTVNDQVSISAGADQSICINGALEQLSDYTASVGTWSGPGITNALNGTFNPVNAGPGQHTITLSTGSGTCLVTDQVTVTVHATPVVSAGANEVFCENEGLVTLAAASPLGGEWQGLGIADPWFGVFNTGAGIGSFNLMYIYQDPLTGCADTASRVVQVGNVPDAWFQVAPEVCQNAPVIPQNESTGATTYEWDFQAAGGQIAGFEPSYAYSATGSYEIALTAISALGCEDEYTETVYVMAAPVAGFNLSQNIGCAPLIVDFENTSQGDDLDYAWSYNGQFSNLPEPGSTTFVEDGDLTYYQVELEVSNQCGTSTAIQEVTVAPRPNADFDMNPLSTMCTPVLLGLDNQSSGTPDACWWLFINTADDDDDDDEPWMVDEPGSITLTTGDEPTDYEILLVVQNECGVDSTLQTITILPNTVHAAFDPGVTQGCSPLHIDIDNQSTGAFIYTFEVPGFPDMLEEEPSFDLVVPGEYEIRLFATDGCGVDSTDVTVDVLATPEVQINASDNETCSGSALSFSADVTGASSLEWNFGDGNTSNAMNVDHTFMVPDSYTVSLIAQADNLCSAESTYDVEVHALPVASFAASESEACSPASFCFDNTSSGALSYQWDFGNGLISSEQNPCPVISAPGLNTVTYTVQLTATNQWACSDHASTVITVHPVPQGEIVLGASGSCDYPVAIDAEFEGTGATQFIWNVNGTEEADGAIVTLDFAEVGEYSIEVVVSNDFGCSYSAEQYFEVYPQPLAQATAQPDRGCLDLDVQFINTSENASEFEWRFDEFGTSAETNPEFTFTETGVFDIVLIAISADGCRDTIEYHNMVETYPDPVALFSMTPEETSIYFAEIEFTNESEGADSYEWNFGDGTYTGEENPVHEYLSPGTWPITLTAINQFGCEKQFTDYVTITNELFVFIPNSFTPDHDGINDYFKPEFAASEFIRSYEFMVFDRWGTIVFKTNDPDAAWNGNVRGGEYYGEANTYRYRVIIETEESSETQVLEGTVTMLR